MKLTPIQVKGKGGPRKTWKAPDPQHVLKRRYEDAMGDDSEDGTRRRRLKTKKPAALIELLPTEILERILFMSMNLNFLRSSRRLGYRFSNQSFLTGLIIEAFAPNWELWFGSPTTEIRSYCGFEGDSERIGGNPTFQSTVLTLPWVNITRILEAQQQWYQKHGTGRYFEHFDPWSISRRGDPSHAPEGFDHGKDVTACFEADWKSFTGCYDTFFSGPMIGCFMQSVYGVRHYIDIHPSTAIPERLLTGPHSLGSAKLLFWLIRGGARLQDKVHSWELTKRGYENIMELSDKQLALHLLRLFAKLGVFTVKHWPEFLIVEKLKEARRQWMQHNSVDQLSPVTRLWWFACEMFHWWLGQSDARSNHYNRDRY